MKKGIFAVSLLVVWFIAIPCWADFSLSITPMEGGSSLRFGQVAAPEIVTRELRVRVTSDLGDRYEVRQRLLDPLEDQGQPLNDGAVKFHTLIGSNSSGTLYQDAPDDLDDFERVLYSSAEAGDGDSFLVVYSAHGSQMNLSGNFLGRIIYRVVPMAGSGTEQQIILNVYLDAEGEFKVEAVTSSRQPGRLTLSSTDEQVAGYLAITTQGSLGQSYEITQRLNEPFNNEQGQQILPGTINFWVDAQAGRSYYPSAEPLTNNLETLYLSSFDGGGDQVVINFLVDKKDLEGLPSGTFSAPLTYQIESQGETLESIPLTLILDIRPVFAISTEAQGGLAFREIQPGQPSRQKEVIVRVNTNAQRPYCVMQQVSAPLTNLQGHTIDSRDFTVKAELSEVQPGEPAITEFRPVEVGDSLVFTSDAQGSPAYFKLIYSLERARGSVSGDYFTEIGFVLVEK